MFVNLFYLFLRQRRQWSMMSVFPKVDDVSEEEMYDCKPVQVTFGRRHYQIIEWTIYTFVIEHLSSLNIKMMLTSCMFLMFIMCVAIKLTCSVWFCKKHLQYCVHNTSAYINLVRSSLKVMWLQLSANKFTQLLFLYGLLFYWLFNLHGVFNSHGFCSSLLLHPTCKMIRYYEQDVQTKLWDLISEFCVLLLFAS